MTTPVKITELAMKLTDYNYKHGHPDYDHLSVYEAIIMDVLSDIEYSLNVESAFKAKNARIQELEDEVNNLAYHLRLSEEARAIMRNELKEKK